MAQKKTDPLSSRELLQRIGLGSEPASDLLLEDDVLDTPLDALAKALQDRCQSLSTAHAFKPGDLVCWKQGLRNRRLPRDGKPAVVLEVLAEPLHDNERESGNTYFREPLSLVLGVFVHEGEHRGDFFTWYYDGRRFQPWHQGDL